jgi:osmotically-inducible protein OsmY
MKTDAKLQLDVLEELKWEPAVNAEQIGVEVKDGIVTLVGHVGSFAEKWHAEEAAQRISGVKALAVEIDVTLPGECHRHDAEIARAAENILEWLVILPKDTVKVMVENGWITLSGELEWGYQRQLAVGAVRYLMGVRGVSDQILITPKMSSRAIKSDIEAALKRRLTDDTHNIMVDIHGSDVTLTGTVHNRSERVLASQSAWSSPGVRKVVDNITIAS